jgi:hypothetical protein
MGISMSRMVGCIAETARKYAMDGVFTSVKGTRKYAMNGIVSVRLQGNFQVHPLVEHPI